MRIIYGSWEPGRSTFDCGHEAASTGYDLIPMYLDGKWHNLFEFRNSGESADIVLSATPGSFQDVWKSANWGKFIMMQESGLGYINDKVVAQGMIQANPDGFLLHNRDLIGIYQVFGRPVYYFDHPYDWEKAAKYNIGPREPDLVMVNLSRHHNFDGNIMGTLAVIKCMPQLRFIAYHHDVENVQEFARSLGILNLTCLAPTCWSDVMKVGSRCSAFLSMDYRVTIGRFAMDAAALSIPCVGAFSEAQAYFYPEYMVSPTEIEKAVDRLNEALSLKGQYEIAAEKKEYLGLKRFGEHFKNVCEEIASG